LIVDDCSDKLVANVGFPITDVGAPAEEISQRVDAPKTKYKDAGAPIKKIISALPTEMSNKRN